MPSPAQNRRDPQQGKNGFSTNKGFTLIELMITLAVIAIITSLALPSYRSIIEKRQVTSGAEQLTAFMTAAQMEAVKRNQQVAISCTMAAGNCQAIAFTDDGNEVLRTIEFSNLKADVSAIAYDPDDDQIVFDPVRGMLIQEDIVTSPLEIQLSSAQGEYALNIRMLPTGRASMCSDTIRAAKLVPGYGACT
jgi:type IV fimbrial biogenesis protein FimT